MDVINNIEKIEKVNREIVSSCPIDNEGQDSFFKGLRDPDFREALSLVQDKEAPRQFFVKKFGRKPNY